MCMYAHVPSAARHQLICIAAQSARAPRAHLAQSALLCHTPLNRSAPYPIS